MSVTKKYVLDANAFIQSKRRFYPFDVCPGYWDALKWHHGQSNLCSIDRVKEELERGGDDLSEWVVKNLPESFFASTGDAQTVSWFSQIGTWVQAQTQFLPEAKGEFISGVDGWLIAYAKSTVHVLVTLEQFDPLVRKRVPIPNVCQAFGIECITTFDMLRGLGVRFTWTPPK